MREPSPINRAENYESGTRAAAAAGYGVLGDMPNTPGHETWTRERWEEKNGLTVAKAYIAVIAIGGSQPQSPNHDELPLMFGSGMRWIKGYAGPTTSNPYDFEAKDFKETFAEALDSGVDPLYMLHPGNDNLEDFVNVAAGDFGLRFHACHLHNTDQIDIIQAAKQRYGEDRISSGLTLHHMLMNSHDTVSRGHFARMVPPLVEQSMAERLIERFAAGDVDCIETDHAPHPEPKKLEVEIANPTNDRSEHAMTCDGVSVIEFAPRIMFNMWRKGLVTLPRIVDAMSTQPARVMGVKLSDESYADWDMSAVDRIREDEVLNGSGYSAFTGMIGTGALVNLVVGGRQIIEDGEFTGERYNVPVTKTDQVI